MVEIKDPLNGGNGESDGGSIDLGGVIRSPLT